MRISVIIPTTDGPAHVLRLAPLHNAPRSVMRTQQDYRPLPVSAAYQAFTAQGGPLDIAFGISASSFDLRLSGRIDTGRSWELPVALTHWLQAQGHLVGVEKPDLLVWATGALDLDMRVINQDYHLPTKLFASIDLLKAAVEDGCRVVVLLPDAATLPEDMATDAVLHQVTSVLEAIDFLRPIIEDKQQKPAAPRITQEQKKPSVARLALLGSIGIVGLTALAVVAGLAWQDDVALSLPMSDEPIVQAEANRATFNMLENAYSKPGDEQEGPRTTGASASTDSPATVLPSLILLRPRGGASCIAVHFGGADPARELHTATMGGFDEASLTSLCAIGLQMPEEATGAWIVQVPEALLTYVTRSERLSEFTLVPGEEQLFRLTAGLPVEFGLRWHVTDANGGTFQVRHRLSILQ
jgi:hypothetical protein